MAHWMIITPITNYINNDNNQHLQYIYLILICAQFTSVSSANIHGWRKTIHFKHIFIIRYSYHDFRFCFCMFIWFSSIYVHIEKKMNSSSSHAYKRMCAFALLCICMEFQKRIEIHVLFYTFTELIWHFHVVLNFLYKVDFAL